ncbi:MAG: YdcF family protein [Peptostreptococcaceae bacterium]
MKKAYLLIGAILVSILIIFINGVNFSDLFVVASIWIIYFSFILTSLAKLKQKKYLTLISKVYNFLVIIFITSFIIIESVLIININQFKEAKEIENVEYLIVLGAGLDGYEVGNILKSRLDKAIEYYNLNKDTQIIVSGGQGKDELISEAEAMSRYLIEQGVNKKQIIKEDKATTTLENIKFSKEILKNRKDENEKLLIVTNEFHLTRAILISNILGMESDGLASKTPIKVRINYLIREYPTMIIDITRTLFQSLNN